MQRIGVFVCWCGSNIAGTVDVEAVSEAISKLPGVACSMNYKYMCSEPGQSLISEKIKELPVHGAVVLCRMLDRIAVGVRVRIETEAVAVLFLLRAVQNGTGRDLDDAVLLQSHRLSS